MKSRVESAACRRAQSLALLPVARLVGALFLLNLGTPAVAQPDAGTLLNQEQRSQQRLPNRLPEAQSPSTSPALKDTGGVRVVVKSVRFTGALDLVGEPELQALVAPAVGKELDFAGLEGLARSVTSFLRSKGWMLAQAYLPKQDVTEGDIDIAVRAGKLDGSNGQGQPFVLVPGGKKPLRMDTARLKAIAAARLPAGAVVNEAELERAMLLMNDLPGISARARLEPGNEADSSRVTVDVEEGPLLTSSLGLDGYGNRDTGMVQLGLAAQLNDLSGMGDQASANATHSEGVDLVRLGYSLPVGSQGLKLGASWSGMRYQILSGTGLAAGLKGESDTTGLTLSYPLLRSRSNNVYATLGFTHKSLKDESLVGVLRDKRVNVWNAALSGDVLDARGGGGLTAWNAGLTTGQLDLSGLPADAAADAAGYDAQGSFDKLNYGISRLQKLPGAFTAFANVSGQAAGKNLDSSEKFLLGGPNGVRAYPGSEGSGDSGWLANFELRYDLPGSTMLGQVQVFGFYDTGHITLHHDPRKIAIATASGLNSYGLAGWGLGATLSKAGSHVVRLLWAEKTGQNPGSTTSGLDADGQADTSRIWLQATLWF